MKSRFAHGAGWESDDFVPDFFKQNTAIIILTADSVLECFNWKFENDPVIGWQIAEICVNADYFLAFVKRFWFHGIMAFVKHYTGKTQGRSFIFDLTSPHRFTTVEFFLSVGAH